MQEISLNVLDIVQNSVKAGSSLIKITVDENRAENYMTVTVEDNGCGMSRQQLTAVTDPFFTTRTTRKVGLGVPLFKMAAEMTGGSFNITSQIGVGTLITARFVYDSIDRMPLGNMCETMVSLIQCNPDIDFLYVHSFNSSSYTLDTREFKAVMGDIPLNDFSVLTFIKEFIIENDNEIRKV